MPLAPEAKVYEKGKFSFYHHQDSVVIFDEKDNSIQFTGAEADRAIKMFDSVGRMVNLKRVPPFIKDAPFEVTFTPQGICQITRDNDRKGIFFKMTDVDHLIEGTQETIKKLIDLKVLRPDPNSHVLPGMGDLPYDGR